MPATAQRRGRRFGTYRVWVAERPDFCGDVTTDSLGRAKAEFRDGLLDAGWQVEFTALRGRFLGGPVTSEGFRRNAVYRGIEFAHVGMCVRLGDQLGRIVGHNASANLDVLFDDGHVLNCHPHWQITYLNDAGEVVASFRKGD